MEFVRLEVRHADALQAFLAAFDEAGEARIPAYFCDRAWDHAQIMATLESWSRGEGDAAGWTANTTRFLEVDGELVGVINVRHQLTQGLRKRGGHVGYAVRPDARGRGHAQHMLREALVMLRAMEQRRVLVTCGDENAASARVIERCGGVLEDITEDEQVGGLVRRYWIEV
jgi:predicted acetyltransferase